MEDEEEKLRKRGSGEQQKETFPRVRTDLESSKIKKRRLITNEIYVRQLPCLLNVSSSKCEVSITVSH